MGNISGKINLASLEHKVIKTKNGTDCIVLPIKSNNLFLSEKGNVFLDISANEHINAEKKQTHIVNQSVPKDVYDKLKAAGEYAPTLGNLTDWEKLSGGGNGEPTPNQSANFDPAGSDEDLPF